jgi:5-methylcytosine-specific restriction endonuclease McrA
MEDPMPELNKLRAIAKDLQDKKGTYWRMFPNLKERPDLIGWLLHEGQCVYCGTDLVEVYHMTMRLGETDHLLPKDKNKYPELEGDVLNLVPACHGCNGLKLNWDPNTDGPHLYIRENESQIRDENIQRELISRATKYIDGERQKRRVVFRLDQANWLEALRQSR